MTNIIITGSNGRMGEALSRCATHHAGLNVVGTIDMGDDLGSIIDQGDVIIDFSFHEVTLPFASLCAERNKGLVIGTTGHSEEDRMAILELTSRIPIVWASNYSTGVNTLFWLTRKATEILGTDFDLEVVEMHHRMKRDAPSGTAMTLAEILSEACLRKDFSKSHRSATGCIPFHAVMHLDNLKVKVSSQYFSGFSGEPEEGVDPRGGQHPLLAHPKSH